MTTTFAQAVNAPAVTQTTNGMSAYTQSGSKVLDLFYGIGSARNNPEIVQTFMSAFGHNPLLATKCLFWARDIRGGAGERKVFRDILQVLESVSPATVEKNLANIPVYGRWDDGFVLSSPRLRKAYYDLVAAALADGNGLAAKWCPRKGRVAEELRAHMKLSPKSYRKLIVGLSNTVEQSMCAKEWDKINYAHVPSVAAARYQTAFTRNDTERYQEYKNALAAGTAKINASALYPHDVIRTLNNSADPQIAISQWDALPNYVGDRKILPVSDVSGSMSCKASGSVTCMDVSIALGLYLASKNTGAFKDVICTFSAAPQLMTVEGNLAEKYNQLSSADWGMNTNIEAVFNLILKVATDNNVPAEDMPEAICILSDMQFDAATERDHWDRQSSTWGGETALEMIRSKYAAAGYNAPVVVFWNLNGSYGNTPSSSNEQGVVQVSGFSPSIMKSVLAMDFDSITPAGLMLEVLMSDRYAPVTV